MSFEGEAMTYAGIDVGKKTLDLALLSSASGEVRRHRFRNSERGRSALLNLLSLLQPAAEHPYRPAAARLAVVALEASGVYHIPYPSIPPIYLHPPSPSCAGWWTRAFP